MKQAVHSQKGRPVLRLEKLIRLVLEVIGLCRSSFFRIAEQQYPAVRFKARYLRERRIESPQPVNLRNVSYGFAKVFVFRFFRKQTDAFRLQYATSSSDTIFFGYACCSVVTAVSSCR